MTNEEILFSKFSGPAVIISFANGRVTNIKNNDQYLMELGMNVSSEDFIKINAADFFEESDYEVYIDAIKECIANDKKTACETARKLVSNCCGEDRVIIRSSFALMEAKGDEYLVFETIRNLTTESETLVNLRESDRRFRIASEQVNIYYWEYTVATREMRPCFRCMRDLGLPALLKDYPNSAIERGIFPADYADMYRDWHRQIAEGADKLEAIIPLTADRIPFRVRYTTEFDENGKPYKAYGSATLVTEDEIERNKLDDAIIGTLSNEYSFIMTVDIDKNEACIIRTEFPQKPGESSVVKYSDVLAYATESFEDLSAEENKRLLDFDYLRNEFFVTSSRREITSKSNSGQWIRVVYQALDRKENGRTTKMLVSFVDIDDLAAQKYEADVMIAKQKAALEENQKMLIKAAEEANKANEAKTAFFFNMSHDIRTPMNAILGFSKLASEEIDNREALSEYLGRIQNSGEHLLSLINDILDMSRIESGKMEIVASANNIREISDDCFNLLKGQMLSKKIDFTYDVSNIKQENIYCDKLKIKQVILNILSNACKFTPEGGKVSFWVTQLTSGEKPEYEIRIKDNGIGMSEEFSKQIWEPFSRESNEKVNEIQGTGLGMSIVKNIVNLMKGTITLNTRLGKGSEFIINIPLEACNEITMKPELKPILGKDYSGKTLLLVDDISANRLLANILLKKMGFSIIEATNGIEAVEIVTESNPGDIDIILMDVMMPVMDGLEATRKIRTIDNKKLASLPIIAMTANAFDDDIKATRSAGMNDHITKPIVKDDLIRIIEKNL